MKLDPRNATLDVASVKGRIGHEIGHPLGLAQAMASCGSSTLMSDGNMLDSGALANTNVTSNDVAQVRRNKYANGQCTVVYSGGTQAAECYDDDYDMVSTCDGDCDDFDPGLTYNCGGEGGGSCNPALFQECLNVENATWNEATCECTVRGSPVLVDTSGDGFRLTDAAEGVRFDLDSDGTPERLAWTARDSDDAWLAMDRDGDGRVGSGRELFGNFTEQPGPPPGEGRNGFLALAEFDRPEQGGNGDGVVDDRDAVFASLRLWLDADQDGISRAEELHRLESLGVERLRLDYKESRREDEYGNQFRYRAKVEDARGGRVGRWAWDVFLVTAR